MRRFDNIDEQILSGIGIAGDNSSDFRTDLVVVMNRLPVENKCVWRRVLVINGYRNVIKVLSKQVRSVNILPVGFTIIFSSVTIYVPECSEGILKPFHKITQHEGHLSGRTARIKYIGVPITLNGTARGMEVNFSTLGADVAKIT